MTSKHTPGKWKINSQTYSIRAETVGTVVYGNPDNPNRKADAHLIVAAPAMLAALREARMVLTQGKGVPATAPVIKTIDAAIAQTECP